MGRILNALKDRLARRGRRDAADEYFDRNEAETDVRRVRLESMGRDPLAVQESLKEKDRPPH